MADRPILFSAPMVRAILDGTKSQTRRVLKPQPSSGVRTSPFVASGVEDGHGREINPRIWPGYRLWVRETWKPHSIYAEMKPRDIPKTNVFYRADDRYAPSNTPWVTPIHMPRWASRITLLVDEVRVQRLQEINEEDAVAEGIDRVADNFGNGPAYCDYTMANLADTAEWFGSPIRSFTSLWNSINGPGAWEKNPWVMAVTFRPVLANIDEVK